MTDHDYAGCQEPLCRRCEDYSAGYQDGESKALFGISTQTTHHAAGCGCDPCQAVAERLRRRVDLRKRPNPESERDASALPAGLSTELALLLGIEPSDGDLL